MSTPREHRNSTTRTRLVPVQLGAAMRYRAHVRHEPELNIARRMLSRGGWFIDVGANHGTYIDAALLAGAFVTAIEPQATLVNELTGRYPAGRVEVIHAAAKPGEPGVAELYQPVITTGVLDSRASLRQEANTGFELARLEVPTRSVDQIVTGSRFRSRNAQLLKIDVEGFEVEVLHACEALLNTARPAVLIEVERRHHPDSDPWEAFTVLSGHGYEGWCIDAGALRPLSEFDPERHQPLGVVKDPLAAGRPAGLVNNFLFVHPNQPAAVLIPR